MGARAVGDEGGRASARPRPVVGARARPSTARGLDPRRPRGGVTARSRRNRRSSLPAHGGCGMRRIPDDERLARVLLCRVAEPGEAALAAKVAAEGAVAVVDSLL